MGDEKPKHSPGPWGVGLAENGVYIDAGGITIAQVFGLRGNENAALISRAPDLLAILRELEWMDGDHGEACPVCKSIRYGFPKRGDSVHAPDCRLSALLRELE